MDFLNVISFGAGKQSTYMLIKALDGCYSEKPDFAIFSDTGAEPSWTYEHVDFITKYVKDKYDFDIIVLNNGSLINDTIDYVDGKTKRVAQLPYRVEKDRMLMRQCTQDYKLAPIKRYLQSVRKRKKIKMWIGISLDEMERMKDSNVKYIENYYPLYENRISISDIKKWYQTKKVIPEPGKSSCIICPFRSISSWQYMRKNYPNDFKTAIMFDEKIRSYPKIIGRCFINNAGYPIKDLQQDTQINMFPELIEECFGICGL